MKKYSGYIAYFVYWIFYFLVTRALFLVYHYSLTATLTTAEIFKVFTWGFRMDVSFTSYICIFPFLLFLARSVAIKTNIKKIVEIYTICIAVVLSFLATADLELYSAWGYRMDITPFQYFKSPKEMGTTVSSAPLLLLFVIFTILSAFFIWIYKKYIDRYISITPFKFSIANAAISLFLVVFLFVPIRGGIQKIPLNQSFVYFSEKLFADHAALNLPWNLLSSVLNKNSNKNPFDYLPKDTAARLVSNLYSTGPLKIPSVLSTKRPNIIFIIMESFTAKFVGCLGGEQNVTPNLDKIAADGLLFTNIYAAGDRSEKGLIAVLSGYPNQAITSIIKTPGKLKNFRR